MIKNLLKIGFASVCVALLLISCGKDKPVTSENTEVLTTAKGQLYQVDTLNSKIEWKGYKIVKSDQTSHIGTIKLESGDVTINNGKLESGKFVANLASLDNTDLKEDHEKQNKLVQHLHSADFLNVEKFPTASFEIAKITENQTGDYNQILDGNLTIKGITKPVSFKANTMVKDGVVSISTEPTDINREDFGISFQIPAENGVIKNEITLQISLKANETN